MNINLIFLIIFTIFFWIVGFLNINIDSSYFLSSFLNNEIWQLIFISALIFIFGKRYIDEVGEDKRFENILKILLIIWLTIIWFTQIYKSLWLDVEIINQLFALIKLNYWKLIIFNVLIIILIFWINKIEINIDDNYDHKYSLLLIITLTILGFLLRIYNIDYPNLFTDETASIIIYNDYVNQGYTYYPRWIIFYYIQYLIINFLWLSDFSLKIFPIIIWTLSVPVIFFITKKLFDSKTALLSSILVATSPILISFSIASRMYILFYILFFILIIISLQEFKLFVNQIFKQYLRWFSKRSLYIVPIIILAYDSQVATIHLVFFLLSWLIFYFFLLKKKLIFNKKTIITWSILIFLIFIFKYDTIKNFIWLINIFKEPNYSYIDRIFNRTSIILLIFYISSAIIFFLKWNEKSKGINIINLWIIFILLSTIFVLNTYGTTRYIWHLIIPFIIVSAYSITIVSNSLNLKIFMPLIISIIIIHNLSHIYTIHEKQYSGYVFADTYRDNYKDAIKYININENDWLISTVPWVLYLYQDKSKNILNYYNNMWKVKKWSIEEWLNKNERTKYELKFICRFETGYYFADYRRFYRYWSFPNNLKKIILENMDEIKTKSKDVFVYKWNLNKYELKKICDTKFN